MKFLKFTENVRGKKKKKRTASTQDGYEANVVEHSEMRCNGLGGLRMKLSPDIM